MRTQEEIDKEYADLCTKFGDLSQKLNHLAEQEKQAEEHFEEQKEAMRLTFAKERGGMESECLKIKNRWKELQVEVQSRVPQSNPE